MQKQAAKHYSEHLWTKKDVAGRNNVSERTVNYWIQNGLLNYVKLGRLVRFIPADVEAFIEAHRIGGTK